MAVLSWTAGTKRASCPVCGDRGTKRGLLRVTDYAEHAGIESEPLELLACPDCDARFYDPAASISHDDAGSVQLYVEQGAGIDVMLQPLNLLDCRPIRRYLEVGCGFGFSLDYARRMLGWQVRGFDPGLLAAEGRRLLDLPISSAYFNGAAADEGSSDLVFCSEVIEHIAEPVSFLQRVREALHPDGLLLMTTPNAEAVQAGAGAELMLILSPGHHLVLYTERTMRRLLHENGFPYLRFSKSEQQLRVCASMVPFAGEANYFSRDRFLQYLEDSAPRHVPGSPLALGFGYRLFKELVNGGRYAVARDHYERLRSGILERYGLDIETPDRVAMPASGTLTLSEFGSRWPFNLCGIWYHRAIAQLLDERDLVRAAATFEAASAFGRALRANLQLIGADDLETANLCREAELAQLNALAQCNAPEALAAFHRLSKSREGLDSPTLAAHLARARERLFTDLVNLGHYALAEQVIGSHKLSSCLELSPDGLGAAFAQGIYLLNHKSDFAAASAIFGQVSEAARADAANRHLLWPAKFHQALASRYRGDWPTAKRIADEISEPPPGLPPVPEEYRQRLQELAVPAAASRSE